MFCYSVPYSQMNSCLKLSQQRRKIGPQLCSHCQTHNNIKRTAVASNAPISRLTLLHRVARSTFCQGAKPSPEKSHILRQSAKKRPTIFPNLSAVTKSYEPILSNLLKGSVPQSSSTIAAQCQNMYMIKDRKITTSFPCVAINLDKFTVLDKCQSDHQQSEQNQQTRAPPK